ncbi:MAG: histidine kinase dimerization/phospho-acceptor domain-containing protein, partial [Segatella copri]|nr:histidine kinase dimerization/phospho-acceptor domain-containing protein [Segatella copri]
MHKNNIPLKVALGYSAIAIIMILAISLVYSNTKSINAINEASREYIQKRGVADSTISSLLKEEQRNLKQLSDVMAGRPTQNYLQNKVKNLNTGKDSILVHSKAPQTHEAKKTTVEVLKTRRGFFRRLADAFKKEHAETLSVKQDSNRAVIDSVTTPVNVAENVANILEQIDKKEKVETQDHKQSINREMEELKMVSAKLALRSAKHLSDVHQREKDNMQEAIKKAMEARKHLLWQMELLAIVAFFAIVIMIWFIWRDARKERIYRENLEAANEEIQRIMNQRERLLLTITHDIKAPAASISGFIDLMKDYVSNPQGLECLLNIKNSAAHLSHLVASLLDYHQLENGLMKVQPTS